MDSTDKKENDNDNQAMSEEEKDESIVEEENPMDEGKPSQTNKEEQDDRSSEKVDEEESSKPPVSSEKHIGRKKKITTNRPTGDNEDKPSAPSDVEQEDQAARVKDRPNNPWARRRAILKQSRPVSQPQKTENNRSKSTERVKTKKIAQPKPAQSSDSEETDDKPTTDVKQFAFPQYKILSGATVAAVKMRPQKLVIRRTIDGCDDSKHWAVGLFQPTMMSLKLRLLRLLLVWLFFRVLNKQTSWLSDKMSIGVMDEPPSPPPPRSTQPGERYIKVFHESSPHPIHVRVRRPPGTGPGSYS